MVVNRDVIRTLLKENQWSQNELANRVGVSRVTISRILNNKRGAGRKVIGGLIRTFPNQGVSTLFIDIYKNKEEVL
ncbi:helix-turn-helix transcriptional regulator [Clostridium cellulovorans]|uniref:Helix-turn-helix domain protein n=1 Tax=Clostridium cellulovorans (strain ATCC 35296 / DSM 3052 / OCM 3 / 743B) TaxID=573061 RepID=D9SSD0_CLOC7|nr:helix-turn-helix transcriptional regulator [Clostridium cellulovorans]ADL50527.1 helix-turn-helix domain protein [Clostridium cellulovorans 743B]